MHAFSPAEPGRADETRSIPVNAMTRIVVSGGSPISRSPDVLRSLDDASSPIGARRFAPTDGAPVELAALPLAVPVVAGWAVEQTAVRVIGAGLLAWHAASGERTRDREAVLLGILRQLSPLLSWGRRQQAAALSNLRRTVPLLAQQSGADLQSAALLLFRGLTGTGAASSERGRAGSRPAVAPDEVAGRRTRDEPPMGRGPRGGPEGPPVMLMPPGSRQSSRATGVLQRLQAVRAQLDTLSTRWRKAPWPMTAKDIHAGARFVPTGLQRQLDALTVEAPTGAAYGTALGAVQRLAQTLEQGAVRFTVHQAVAGRTSYSPATLQALQRLAEGRLAGAGDAPLRDALSDRLARSGALVNHTQRGRTAHGAEAANVEQNYWLRQQGALTRVRDLLYRQRSLQLPAGADSEARLERLDLLAAQSGLQAHVLRRAAAGGLVLKPHAAASGAGAGATRASLPTRSSGSNPGAGSGGGYVVYQQLQQQPQQASRPDGSDGETLQAQLNAFLKAAGQPNHLRSDSVEGGQPQLEVDVTRLKPKVREAYEALLTSLGPTETGRPMNALVNALVNALILGHGDQWGLRALCEAWQEQLPSTPLTVPTLLNIARVVFNAPEFGSLTDLESLSGLEAPHHLGILPPSEYLGSVKPWIDRSLGGLDRFIGLPPNPQAEDIEQAYGMLEHLRAIQLDYDAYPDQNVSDLRPWPRSNTPGFVETLAAQEAFWLALWSEGLTVDAMNRLTRWDSSNLEAAVDQAPALAQLDFARAYILSHDTLLTSLTKIMGGFDASNESARLQQSWTLVNEAVRIAGETFRNDDLYEGLRKHLTANFMDPRSISAYARSPEFEAIATRLVMDQLEKTCWREGGVGLLFPWVKQHFRRAAIDWAVDAADQSGPSSRFTSKFQALEYLALDPAATSERRQLGDASLRKEMSDGLLIGKIDQMLSELAADPAATEGQRADRGQTATTIGSTVHETVLGILGRRGVVATLERDPTQTDGMVFVVDPAKSVGPRGALPGQADPPSQPMERRLLDGLMHGVCGRLNEGHYMTRFSLSRSSPGR
jgi:hypothetical protein